MKLYHDKDADIKALKGKTITIIGYGAQGHAQAQMLKASGINVLAGVRPDDTAKQAKKDGIKTASIEEAAKKGDIIHILIPDEVQKEVYESKIKPYLTPGKTLSFSHGFNIVFKRIKPPKGVDVIMVAPKAPGTEELKCYKQGFGVPALICVHTNATGKAKKTALAMAKAMYFTKAGVMEATFEQETYEDLFGEQTVLCGGMAELIKAGFEVLVEAGYPPELAYFECLHETKLIMDLIYEGGIARMYHVVSNTAEFGGRTVGPKIIDKSVKKRMKAALKDVESGKFAKIWMNEYKKGLPKLKKLRAEEKKHQIEVVGAKIRKLFEKK